MNTMMAQKADFEKKIKEFEEQLADEEQFADEIETIKVKGEEKMNKMRGQIGELENKIKGVEEEKRHRDGQIKVRTALTSLKLTNYIKLFKYRMAVGLSYGPSH